MSAGQDREGRKREKVRLGVVGARGYAGGELLRLVQGHGGFEVVHLASRQLAGKPFSALAPGLGEVGVIAAPDPGTAARARLDACVLAMPNGEARAYAEAFDALSPDTVVVDFSADFRGAPGWAYGLPELDRKPLEGAKRIANPGCYATAVALALDPLKDLLAGPATAFGVSGWSGAGTTPSPRNDEKRLEDNVMPYSVAGHGHEREIREALGGQAVSFTPAVAGFFRGMVAVVHAPLTRDLTTEHLANLFQASYAEEPLVAVQVQPPEAKDRAGHTGALVGGFGAVPEERRAVVCCAIDNLLKGAASQALQNLNLALGFPEVRGVV